MAGAFADYLPPDGIVWILEDPDLLVRNYPLRFEKRKPGQPEIATLHELIDLRAKCGDRMIGLCEIDTEPSIFDGAERLELATEASANYRSHPDAEGRGIDRFESETGARTRFEIQIADWAAKEKLAIHFAVSNTAEAGRIAEHLAENPLCRKLKPTFHEGAVGGARTHRQGGAQGPVEPLSGAALRRRETAGRDRPRFCDTTSGAVCR